MFEYHGFVFSNLFSSIYNTYFSILCFLKKLAFGEHFSIGNCNFTVDPDSKKVLKITCDKPWLEDVTKGMYEIMLEKI